MTILPESQRIPLGTAQENDVAAGKTFMSEGSFKLKTGTSQPTVQTGGDAQPEHVLGGKTFTNDNGEQTGSMFDGRNQQNVPTRQNVAPGGFEVTPTFDGYIDNTTTFMILDNDFQPENILATKEVFGLAGTATNDADATPEDIAQGKTAYVNGQKVTGTAEPAQVKTNNVSGTGTLSQSNPNQWGMAISSPTTELSETINALMVKFANSDVYFAGDSEDLYLSNLYFPLFVGLNLSWTIGLGIHQLEVTLADVAYDGTTLTANMGLSTSNENGLVVPSGNMQQSLDLYVQSH